MRSSLKKSLYLGLAALSFASVAGAAFENTTASAKKTTKAKKTAKKTTKKATTSYSTMDLPVNIAGQDSLTQAYTLKTSTLTNKPAGVKGSREVATNVPSNTYFMAYQTVQTRGGKKAGTFTKVVSWDKKYRGFVATSDLNSATKTYNDIDLGNNSAVYLKNPGSQAIYSKPQGSTYKPQVAFSASETSKFASAQFGINEKATVTTTGETVYHIVNLANTNIQGWVKASDVTSTPGRYFDQSADIKVNFVNNGDTVASQIVNVTNNPAVQFNNLSTDRVLTGSFVSSIFNLDNNGQFTVQDANGVDNLTSLLAGVGSGYAVTNADLSYSKQNLGTVKVGDTVNIQVSSTANDSQATSKLKFKSIEPTLSGSSTHPIVQWNPADAKDIDSAYFPTLTDAGQAAYNADFTGNKGSFVGSKNGKGLNAIFNDSDVLFGSNGALSHFVGNTNTSITSSSQYTNGYVSNSDSKANNNNDGQTTNAFNNQNSGMLAFSSDAAAYAAGAKTTDTYSLSQVVNDNQGSLAKLKIGQQYHYAYIIDRQATMQYNAWATLYGQPITVVYDAVPVATPVSTTSSTSGFTDYKAN